MPHGHEHDPEKSIKTAFFLNFGFSLLEIAGGVITNSVAILSDALHDLGDSLSLVIAWIFERYSKREADAKYSFGYRRFSLLGAFINGFILVGGSIFILTRAVPRLLSPEPTRARFMVIFAVVGIIVNGIAVLRLKRGKSYNERIVFWHLFEDVLGWVVILIMSIVLVYMDLYIIDPILSIVITIYVLINVLRVVRKTVAVFLQSVPGGFDIAAIESDILSLDRVLSVHHTHIWSLDGVHNVLSTHVVVDDECGRDEIIAIKHAVKEMLEKWKLTHLTVEVEYNNEECEMREY